MGIYGRPPTVLKTAGVASVNVCRRPLEFDRESGLSVIVWHRPRPFIGLAVILAVKATKFGSDGWESSATFRISVAAAPDPVMVPP